VTTAYVWFTRPLYKVRTKFVLMRFSRIQAGRFVRLNRVSYGGSNGRRPGDHLHSLLALARDR
jgi:hypothetical protein